MFIVFFFHLHDSLFLSVSELFIVKSAIWRAWTLVSFMMMLVDVKIYYRCKSKCTQTQYTDIRVRQFSKAHGFYSEWLQACTQKVKVLNNNARFIQIIIILTQIINITMCDALQLFYLHWDLKFSDWVDALPLWICSK